MKARNFPDGQKAFILRQADEGAPIGDIWRKAGISEATCSSWRKQCGSMTRRRCAG
jgi:putative transposase